MIQIGKLRAFINDSGDKIGYFKTIPDFIYKTHKELFDNFESDVLKLPEEERFNLFYTVAHHTEGARKFATWQAQDLIPFDLDGIDLDRIDEYAPVVCEALNIDINKIAIVYTGNGIHILIKVKLWKDKTFIKESKPAYGLLYDKIVKACEKKELAITKDTTAWDYGRILRLPFTENRKVQKDDSIKIKQCVLKQNNLEEQELPLFEVQKEGQKKSLRRGSFPNPDKETILKECHFFKWLKEKPEEVHEPHAYAMLSITGNFDDDNKISKELFSCFSSPSIDSKDVDEFIIQALSASGPRTCEGIDEVWSNCKHCPHYNNITSPILLRSKNYIGTEKVGFTLIGSKGGKVRQYKDLTKVFDREFHYKNIGESVDKYVYKDGY